MGFSKISIALIVCVVGLAMVHQSRAQNSPQDYVDAHNSVRAQVGVGPMVWNNTVAAFAQNYANRFLPNSCFNLVHSGGPYGENLAASSGDFTGRQAVSLWADERQYYDYNSNSCQSGRQCGHYTQVVWRSSTQLGCARVQCSNGDKFVTCNYYPRGNFVGQRPY